MIFFTSDTHFGHTNIIKYCDRPFSNVQEMDEFLITEWNKVVRPNDTIYHLGDFCFSKNPDSILCRLNGKKHLIIGNHDNQKTIDSVFWESVGHYKEISFEKQFIVLCHYAMKVWNKSHRGAWHLYGHSHGTLPEDPFSFSFDAGVDCHDYKPISFEQIKERMNKKKFMPYDHHTSR